MITIIIPYHNSREYITKTLESLVNQTYGDFHVVFIADGSTDGTSQYVKEYVRNKDINYQIIESEHRGVSHARNIGLSYVNTPYFMFLDSDDYLDHDMLKTSLEILTKHDLDAVMCKYDRQLDGRRVWEYSDSYQGFEGLIDGISLLDKIFDNQAHIIISNLVYKSVLAEGLHFHEESTFHEDIHFCYRALSRARKIGFIPRVLVHYTIRSHSITTELDTKKLIQSIQTLELLHEDLSKQIEGKIAEKVIKQVIPETLLHFLKNLSVKENIINVFRSNGYLGYLKQYRMSRRNFRYLIKYIQIKWIALFPGFYVYTWRFIRKYRN